MAEPVPTIDDLTVHARLALELRYKEAQTRRAKCSLDDFAAGYLSSLLMLKVSVFFKPESHERLGLHA